MVLGTVHGGHGDPLGRTLPPRLGNDRVGKWLAYHRVTGELVGRGGLSCVELEGSRYLELGWTLHPDHWGHGYATEIGRAGLAFAFGERGADQVVAYTEPHNRRSRAVMERLGMRHLRDITHLGERFVLYHTTAA